MMDLIIEGENNIKNLQKSFKIPIWNIKRMVGSHCSSSNRRIKRIRKLMNKVELLIAVDKAIQEFFGPF